MPTDKHSFILAGITLLTVLYIIFSGPLFILNIPFLLMQIFGLLLIAWAFLARKVNRNLHSNKLPGGSFFVNKGPYEIIRHPIYAGFLLIMAGRVEETASLQRFFALAILIIVVLLKIVKDEYILDQHVKEYAGYKTKTYRLIPYLY